MSKLELTSSTPMTVHSSNKGKVYRPEFKNAERMEIERLLASFLSNGGEIEKVEANMGMVDNRGNMIDTERYIPSQSVWAKVGGSKLTGKDLAWAIEKIKEGVIHTAVAKELKVHPNTLRSYISQYKIDKNII